MNQLLWSNIWRHPLLDYRKPDWRQMNWPQAGKFYWMEAKEDLITVLSDFKNKGTKNNDFIDLLEFTLKLKRWLIQKNETQILFHNPLDSIITDQSKVLQLFEENISTLSNLKKDYSILWKRNNREANLWMIEDKFDRLNQGLYL